VLVTLLVLWVVVVPALTVAGTCLLSRILGRRLRAHQAQPATSAPALSRLASARMLHHQPVRARSHARRPRGHVLTRH
jgi:hypothetical protein